MRPLVLLAPLLAVSLSACLGSDPPPDSKQPPAESTAAPEIRVEVVAEGLDTVWGMAFSSDGRVFLTERPGRIRVLEGGILKTEPWATLDVVEQSESGLMGIALHPKFPQTPHLFVYATMSTPTGNENWIIRFRQEAGRGIQDAVLLKGIPAGNIHDGGRLKFGPDGKLWATTGDAGVPSRSQDDLSLGGKVLRLNDDGTIPLDNPNPAFHWWTKGHRNVQGIDWHPISGLPYITEHGPQVDDEINILRKGRNYAWPLTGRQNNAAFEDPIYVYRATIAPAGAAFFTDPLGKKPEWKNAFFFATLKEKDLRVLHLDPETGTQVVKEEVLYDGEYGRLRDVVPGPDGNLYVGTSNHDGRGSPRTGDDKVLRLAYS